MKNACEADNGKVNTRAEMGRKKGTLFIYAAGLTLSLEFNL